MKPYKKTTTNGARASDWDDDAPRPEPPQVAVEPRVVLYQADGKPLRRSIGYRVDVRS